MERVIPVFIGSPGDVKLERPHCELAVKMLAPTLAEVFGVTLVPLRWEQFAPISSADATHPQVEILRRIKPYSIFIGILRRRYGTTVKGMGRSGTQVEFEHALQNRDKISILTYFLDGKGRAAKTSRTSSAQSQKVAKLRRQLQAQNVWVQTYKSPKEFAERITSDILEAALKIILGNGSPRLRHYTQFFKFGEGSHAGERPMYIVYPPLTREPYSRESGTHLDWQARLLPRVVYEDSKAIQDVEAAMRMLQRRYRTVTLGSPELSLADGGDRVWICLPRNSVAQEVLAGCREKDASRLRFRFERRSFKGRADEVCLFWRGKNGKEILVRSPLGKYLGLSQRPRGLAEWHPLYGHIVARDYAVIARIPVAPDDAVSDRDVFYHYFIGGIRGLGTWGAGWFIDHRSKALAEAAAKAPTGDIQLLLEVTYKDYRITDVTVVSDQDAEYFRTRFSQRFVKGELTKAQPLLSVGSRGQHQRR